MIVMTFYEVIALLPSFVEGSGRNANKDTDLHSLLGFHHSFSAIPMLFGHEEVANRIFSGPNEFSNAQNFNYGDKPSSLIERVLENNRTTRDDMLRRKPPMFIHEVKNIVDKSLWITDWFVDEFRIHQLQILIEEYNIIDILQLFPALNDVDNFCQKSDLYFATLTGGILQCDAIEVSTLFKELIISPTVKSMLVELNDVETTLLENVRTSREKDNLRGCEIISDYQEVNRACLDVMNDEIVKFTFERTKNLSEIITLYL
jgi:hypothetical protein